MQTKVKCENKINSYNKKNFVFLDKSMSSNQVQNNNSKVVDNVKVNITYKTDSAQIGDDEIRRYIQRGNLSNPNTVVGELGLVVYDDEVEVEYNYEPVPFDRIRRITGYLVGNMDRWNDAKTHEEADRVKHEIIK